MLEVQKRACKKINDTCDIDSPEIPTIAKQVTKKKRNCQKCGKPFQPLGNRQKFCSPECGSTKLYYKKPKELRPVKAKGLFRQITPEPKLKEKTRSVIAKVERNFIHKGTEYIVIDADQDYYYIADDAGNIGWYDKSFFE